VRPAARVRGALQAAGRRRDRRRQGLKVKRN
jgi:hypothetical protein